MKRISRRSCLKAGATFMILPSVSARCYAANERLNVACVGVGGMGKLNRQRIRKIGENIVALCDVDSLRLEAAASEHPKATTWVDYREMLDKQKNIDALMVSTPDHTHAAISIAGLKHGKHVCCEKPLARSIHELRALAEVARKTKLATQVEAEGHAYDGLRQIVECVQTGVLGEVSDVDVWSSASYRPKGWPERPKTQPVPAHLNWDLWLGPARYRDYHAGLHPGAWRRWWDFGTGVLGDWCGHLFDGSVWSLGLKGPVTVTPQWGGDVAEVPPKWSIIKYTFHADGNRDPVTLTWYGGREARPPRPKELEPNEELPRGGYVLNGSKEKMLVHGRQVGTSDRGVLLPTKKMETFKPPKPILPRVRDQEHLHEWVRACKEGTPTSCPFDGYGSRLIEIGLIGVVAVRAGREIQWDTNKSLAEQDRELDPLVSPEYRKGWQL